jgi:glycosyltransferase involved in cell wall biosynthesis
MGIKNKLEIVIITFNRAHLLKNTLIQFCSSPFASCKITVLNNSSTDDTIEVCHTFFDKFDNFQLITNKFNIGGGANFMRSIELVNSDYIWVVCDDDEFDFRFCNDVIDCIINDKVDLINVGAHGEDRWSFGGQLKTVKELVYHGYPFFKAASFIPNNIFRVSKFRSFIIEGYKNIANMYPHMPFLLSNYIENNYVYVSKNRIVTAIIEHQKYNGNDWINSWLNTSKLLLNKKVIKLCFFSQWKIGYINEIVACLSILFRFFFEDIKFNTAIKPFYMLSFTQKIVFHFALLPYFIFRMIYLK